MADFIYAGDAGAFKTCSKCDQAKLAIDFPANRLGLLGRKSSCRSCENDKNKVAYRCNSETINEKRKKMRDENLVAERIYRVEKARAKRRLIGVVELGSSMMCVVCGHECIRKSATQKFCTECSGAEQKMARRRWRIDNRELVNEQRRARRAREPDRHSEYSRKWVLANRQSINDRERKRYAEDHRFRLDKNMSRAIRSALSSGKNGASWETLLGYTVDNLISHLERQFAPGMSWGNYGKWHVDHEIPKSVFNYDNEFHIDFRRCWSLANLRPLWERDNKVKSDKLDMEFQPSLMLTIGGHQ